jgi:sterol 3beta-glucosyltransferase
MKLTVVTYGTEGDTRPIVALCRGLIDANHEVKLLTAAGNLNSARALGVPHSALAGDIRDWMRSIRQTPSFVPGKTSIRATSQALKRLADENSATWLQQVLDTAVGSHALIASGLAGYVASSAAEKLSIPLVGAGMIPLTPTSAFPSPLVRPHAAPGWVNRWSYQLVNESMWRIFQKATNAARAHAGLSPGKKIWRGYPMLYGVSPTLLPRPADWPDDAHLCGQWFHPSAAYQPSPSLSDFLSAGEPPIYLGFGSLAGLDKVGLFELAVDAVGSRRTILYPGWREADPPPLPPNIFLLGDTPHDWLFPRTSLAIHHGGSGTTHSAARAGVPSVVLPFAADQFFWADRLRRLGIAPAAPSAQKVTAAALNRAIVHAQTAGMRERARLIGEKMRTEDGVRQAVAHLEHLLAR